MRVLILGDSQAAGAPGQILEGLLEGLGVVVLRIAKSGNGALDWSRRHWADYERAVAGFRPDDVILIFGSNNAASDALKTAMERFRVSGPRRVWYAGPPWYRDPVIQARGIEIRKLARRVFGKHYLDAWPITGAGVPRRPDGVHFNPEGGRVWALGILNAWGRGVRAVAPLVVALVIGVVGLWWLSRRR